MKNMKPKKIIALRELRKILNCSRKQLSYMLDINVNTIMGWEQGCQTPSEKSICKINNLIEQIGLEVEIDYFHDRFGTYILNVYQCRKLLGLSRKEFCEKIKASKISLIRWEAREVTPQKRNRRKIEKAVHSTLPFIQIKY